MILPTVRQVIRIIVEIVVLSQRWASHPAMSSNACVNDEPGLAKVTSFDHHAARRGSSPWTSGPSRMHLPSTEIEVSPAARPVVVPRRLFCPQREQRDASAGLDPDDDLVVDRTAPTRIEMRENPRTRRSRLVGRTGYLWCLVVQQLQIARTGAQLLHPTRSAIPPAITPSRSIDALCLPTNVAGGPNMDAQQPELPDSMHTTRWIRACQGAGRCVSSQYPEENTL